MAKYKCENCGNIEERRPVRSGARPLCPVCNSGMYFYETTKRGPRKGKPNLEKVDGEVYCEMHGCVHAQTTDPYDYGYAESGETPECGPSDWRVLWAGRAVEKEAQ